MKSIATHIQEKLKLSHNLVKNNEFKYYPKNNFEFRKFVADILDNRKDTRDVVSFNEIDTSEITDMSMVFVGLDVINIDISAWNTSKVESFEMMFAYCDKLESIIGLDNFDVSSVKTMKQMFYNCKSLTEINGLEKWNTKNLENCELMFSHCLNLEEINDMSNFNMSNLKNANNMFNYCKKLQYIGSTKSWNINKTCKMMNMFLGAKLKKLP